MAAQQEFTDDQRQQAIVNILNHVTEVLWFFFSEGEEGLDNEESISAFVDNLWDIAIACMASVGMAVVGQNDDGRYILSFAPVDDVKNYLTVQAAAE